MDRRDEPKLEGDAARNREWDDYPWHERWWSTKKRGLSWPTRDYQEKRTGYDDHDNPCKRVALLSARLNLVLNLNRAVALL